MNLKQKFMALAAVSGLIMAVVSIIGFYTSHNNLEESLENEIKMVVDSEGNKLEGWIAERGEVAQTAANVCTALGTEGRDAQTLGGFLATYNNYDGIIGMTVGSEQGVAVIEDGTDLAATEGYDARTRDWYKDSKNKKTVFFTEVYQDTTTKKMVVSASAPFFKNGVFNGAICADITLDKLNELVKEITYRGEGIGYIIAHDGTIIATESKNYEVLSNIKDAAGMGDKFDMMQQTKVGYFKFQALEEPKIFAYTTIPSTDWIVGIAVPESFAFASLNSMKITYFILTIIGIIIAVASCLTLSKTICSSIIVLENHAQELSKGNLAVEDIPVKSNDEIGSLCTSFNTMSSNLRDVIRQMSSTAAQVAASSEELTASAHQSAESAIHVAETVNDVQSNMDLQLEDIDAAKKEVDTVFVDVNNMTEKAKAVNLAANDTADAAKRGSQLMDDAIKLMGEIEHSVMESAEMVKKLGENSEEIGQIIGAISSIADQTNLLALNAAIEAARAGEAGRGFAVVAEEVRKLAAESQESAEEIRNRINSIQDSTQMTVDAMEKGTAEVVEGTKAIREVGGHFTNILLMVDGIQSQIKDITVSVNTVSGGATNIVNAVDNIDSVSRKTAESTNVIYGETEEQSASNEEIAAASRALADLAMDMQSTINKFNV